MFSARGTSSNAGMPRLARLSSAIAEFVFRASTCDGLQRVPNLRIGQYEFQFFSFNYDRLRQNLALRALPTDQCSPNYI